MYPMYGNMNNMGMMPGMPTPAPVMPMQGGMLYKTLTMFPVIVIVH